MSKDKQARARIGICELRAAQEQAWTAAEVASYDLWRQACTHRDRACDRADGHRPADRPAQAAANAWMIAQAIDAAILTALDMATLALLNVEEETG